MQRPHRNTRTTVTAAVLGLATCFSALALGNLLPVSPISVGSIFLFLAVGVANGTGLIAALTFGTLVPALMLNDPLSGFRLALVAVSTWYISRRFARIPGYAIVYLWWIGISGPMLYLISHNPASPIRAGLGDIFLAAICEIISAMTAGALLLNSKLTFALFRQRRSGGFGQIVTHTTSLVIALAALTPMAILSLGGHDVISWLSHPVVLPWSLIMATAVVIVPLLVADRIVHLVARLIRGAGADELLGQLDTQTFSGRSSDLWRRMSSSQMVRTRDNNATQDNSSTANERNPSAIAEGGIIALRRDGTISFINRKFTKLADVRASDPVGKNLANLSANPEVLRAVLETAERTFSKGPKVREVRVAGDNGAQRFFELSSQFSDTLENSTLKGDRDTIIITLRDITHKRTIESHLLQAQKLDALGTVVGGIVHDFSNALTAISAQASVARSLPDRKAVETALTEILRATKAAGDTVRQLADYISAGQRVAAPLDLGRHLEEKHSLLQKIVGSDYELLLEKPAQTVAIHCDDSLLVQALTNLLLNSRQAYGDKQGTITVSLGVETFDEDMADLTPGARAGQFARLRVMDHAFGMSPDVLAKAFDPLFTTRSSKGHAGLGLSIVYAIVRSLDGFLTAESHPGKGTTISLYLPIAQLDARQSIETTRVVSGSNVQRTASGAIEAVAHERILLVEDEPNVRELIATMLGTLGYDVTPCANGDEALDAAKHEPFDLVLVDMIMPRMRGIDVIHKLRGAADAPRTLLMSGSALTADICSVTNVIQKPFDIDTLARVVRATLHPSTLQNAVKGSQSAPRPL